MKDRPFRAQHRDMPTKSAIDSDRNADQPGCTGFPPQQRGIEIIRDGRRCLGSIYAKPPLNTGYSLFEQRFASAFRFGRMNSDSDSTRCADMPGVYSRKNCFFQLVPVFGNVQSSALNALEVDSLPTANTCLAWQPILHACQFRLLGRCRARRCNRHPGRLKADEQ